MKKIILLFGVVLSFSISQSQNSNYDYIFNKDVNSKLHINHYGGLTFQYLEEKSNLMPGLEFGILMNKNLSVGFYGQGTPGNFGNTYENIITDIMFHEEGISLGYLSNSFDRLHFGGSFRIGYASLVSDDKEIKLFQSFEPSAKDHGMVFHPEFFTELNFTKTIRVKIGGGYSFFMLNNENIICDKSLDSFTLNFGVLFGNFCK